MCVVCVHVERHVLHAPGGCSHSADCKDELCVLLEEFLACVDVMDHCTATMAALSLVDTLSENVQTSLPGMYACGPTWYVC